jgi:hypothetical protein
MTTTLPRHRHHGRRCKSQNFPAEPHLRLKRGALNKLSGSQAPVERSQIAGESDRSTLSAEIGREKT